MPGTEILTRLVGAHHGLRAGNDAFNGVANMFNNGCWGSHLGMGAFQTLGENNQTRDGVEGEQIPSFTLRMPPSSFSCSGCRR